MKTCTKCNETKVLEEFASHPIRGVQPYCKECQREASREWYQKNKDRQKTTARKNREKYIQQWKDFKEALHCSICFEDAASCLDFHHLDTTTKDDTVSSLVSRGRTLAEVAREVKKCVVVCRNCHAKIHAEDVMLTEKHIEYSNAQLENNALVV